MHKKKLAAFTLVELLVAMAIIGVLLGLTLFGISAAQRNARDSARKAALQDVNAGIQDYYTKQGSYPGYFNFISGDVGEDGSISLQKTSNSACETSPQECVVVPLEGPANPMVGSTPGNGETAIQPPGSCTGSGPSQVCVLSLSTTQSAYCFKMQDDGYSFSVKLENKTQFDAGTSAIKDCFSNQ
ncbi:MAG: type II secretion system protein [bacterium]